MALPYPTKVVLPFDIATAQDMNERHANDVALANGSGLDSALLANYQTDNGGSVENSLNVVVKVQMGWGQMLGASGIVTKSEAVLFPQTFSTVLGVSVSVLGYTANNSTPISSITGGISAYTDQYANGSATSISSSGFTATITTNQNQNPARHIVYTWIAWGLVS